MEMTGLSLKDLRASHVRHFHTWKQEHHFQLRHFESCVSAPSIYYEHFILDVDGRAH